MARPLKEYFGKVQASDVHPYGFGTVVDFLSAPFEASSVDWVITNPPFRLAEEFVQRSLMVARRGIAILARTVFIESIGRYQGIFAKTPPSRFAQFSERVPMVKGRLALQLQFFLEMGSARVGLMSPAPGRPSE
jgi:hypothetical protein